MGRLRLGLIMILKDEERNLGRSLKPVAKLFDEVLVVDTGSQDQTKNLARAMGAEVVDFEWIDDFAAARNCSLEAARADYLFWLDGDNALSPASVAVLRRAVDQAEEPFIGWCTEVLEPKGGRLIQKRLFPRRPDVFFKGRIHEQLTHPDHFPFVFLGVEIRHWGYQDPQAARSKGQRNLALLKESLKNNPNDFYLLYQTGKTLFQLRRHQEAEVFLEKAVQSASGQEQNQELFSHAWVLWAEAAERASQTQEAEKRLTAALKANLVRPGQNLIHFHLGRLAAQKQAWSEAVAHLSRCQVPGQGFLTLDLDSGRMAFTAAMLLARSLQRLGRVEAAEKQLRRAMELQPDNPAPFRELIRLLLAEGRIQAGQEALNRLLAKWPQDRVGLELSRAIKDAAPGPD